MLQLLDLILHFLGHNNNDNIILHLYTRSFQCRVMLSAFGGERDVKREASRGQPFKRRKLHVICTTAMDPCESFQSLWCLSFALPLACGGYGGVVATPSWWTSIFGAPAREARLLCRMVLTAKLAGYRAPSKLETLVCDEGAIFLFTSSHFHFIHCAERAPTA